MFFAPPGSGLQVTDSTNRQWAPVGLCIPTQHQAPPSGSRHLHAVGSKQQAPTGSRHQQVQQGSRCQWVPEGAEHPYWASVGTGHHKVGSGHLASLLGTTGQHHTVGWNTTGHRTSHPGTRHHYWALGTTGHQWSVGTENP